MTTGLEALAALKKRISDQQSSNQVFVNRQDAMDLRKLTRKDLVGLGWERGLAQCADLALERDDLSVLGDGLGVEIFIDNETPSLLTAKDKCLNKSKAQAQSDTKRTRNQIDSNGKSGADQPS